MKGTILSSRTLLNARLHAFNPFVSALPALRIERSPCFQCQLVPLCFECVFAEIYHSESHQHTKAERPTRVFSHQTPLSAGTSVPPEPLVSRTR